VDEEIIGAKPSSVNQSTENFEKAARYYVQSSTPFE
jgi:hypothetical protein